MLGYSNTPADYAARVRAAALSAGAMWDAESSAAEIEDFGLAENLMIAIAIEDAGGEFVAQQVAGDRMLSDLTGFRRCLAIASRLTGRAGPNG